MSATFGLLAGRGVIFPVLDLPSFFSQKGEIEDVMWILYKLGSLGFFRRLGDTYLPSLTHIGR